MIPKIIHYCWFGNNPKDETTLKFIEGWKKLLPDYELREWNEKDLSKVNNKYVEDAYQSKKWAFVADYFRLYALYNEGGIYFDTDVEVKKSFDEFLNLDFFIGSELYEDNKQIGTAVIGAKKKSPIIAKLLKVYDNIRFIKKNGKLDCTPNTQRLIAPLKELGFTEIYSESNPIYLDKRNIIYPIQYFSKDTPESYAVHHFAASWVAGWKKRLNCTLSINKKYRLTVSKYKNNKKDAQFEYPVHLFKKIVEHDYNNKKLLVCLEKIDSYENDRFIEKIYKKIDESFRKKISLIAIIRVTIRLIKEYIKSLRKTQYWGTDDNIAQVNFKLHGGIGDILIALNYIEQFKDNFSNTDISITVPSYFYEEIKVLLHKHYKISKIYTDKQKTKADIIIELVRCPVIRYADKTKISKVNSKLYSWLNTIINFNLEHKEMLNPGTSSDFLLEKYSIIKGRKRLQEGDINNLLNIKDSFKIHLKDNQSEVLAKFSLNKPYITLQRGIGKADNMDGNKSTRIWAIEYYEKLVDLIKKQYPSYQIVQIGSSDCSAIKGCDFNLCGKTSFEEMLTILNDAKLHIDGECGMVHLRHFIDQRPSVVLFGPTNENFYGYKENINLSNRSCSLNCEWLGSEWRKKCIKTDDRAECMKELTPEDVFNKLRNSLK